MSVIAFPRYCEVELLMNRYGIKNNDIDKQLVKVAITEVRKTHGVFQERHFKAVVQLLAHDWLPTDIPVLLPPPTAELYR
ncbi:hypothetical protein [Colwellia piezophila]|uniref:hypothetical protein n=1 Tax=Colwellia piezophila TaxID=211668 RepID=UPI00036DE541|nr:hypothetical protein [Colwellia piezophila]